MKYYTYKRQVPLKPGERLGYMRGKGYYAIPAPKPVPPVVPPPKVNAMAEHARYVLFADEAPLEALHAPAKYAVALSADVAFASHANAETVKALRDGGHRVYSWCDCSATPYQAAKDMKARLGLDEAVGQAEDSAQFDQAFNGGASVIVGNRNPDLLTAEQIKKIDIARAAGLLGWIGEHFWNEGWGMPDRSTCDAVMHGIYPTSLWNPQIGNYQTAGYWADGDGLFHVISVEDWQNLP